MYDKIDFGTIGLKINDTIVFKLNKKKYTVASGVGVPGNGGSLIRWSEDDFQGSMSIIVATKKLLGSSYNKKIDIYCMWDYNEETLRDIYLRNKSIYENRIIED